jgi:hypothetical protein
MAGNIKYTVYLTIFKTFWADVDEIYDVNNLK